MEKIIYSAVSTNGRWGCQIVGPDVHDDLNPGVGYRGRFVPLGRAAGMACFRFDPDPDGDQYAVVLGDAVAPDGAGSAVVYDADLQSHNRVTLLHVRIGGVVQSYGYQRRSSRFRQLQADGSLTDFPAAILLSAGLVTPKDVPPAAPDAPPFNCAFADALRKAGVE
jgi:hypothetical protein